MLRPYSRKLLAFNDATKSELDVGRTLTRTRSAAIVVVSSRDRGVCARDRQSSDFPFLSQLHFLCRRRRLSIHNGPLRSR